MTGKLETVIEAGIAKQPTRSLMSTIENDYSLRKVVLVESAEMDSNKLSTREYLEDDV
jgi:hypothetical protein